MGSKGRGSVFNTETVPPVPEITRVREVSVYLDQYIDIRNVIGGTMTICRENEPELFAAMKDEIQYRDDLWRIVGEEQGYNRFGEPGSRAQIYIPKSGTIEKK